jgi:uncharacterized phage protein gp47/JayE
MAKVDPPKLDPRNEDEVVANAIADLPPELTDRNASSDAVKLLEAGGAFYGALVYYLNQIPRHLYLTLLKLVGIERNDATEAAATLEFTAAAGKSPTVSAGTIVKTGSDSDAIAFETDAEITLSTGGTETVEATAQEAGADGNVAADELTELEQPISGVDAVTNPKAASGGQDAEPIDALLERAPVELRRKDSIITAEDYVLAAENVAGVERALTRVDSGTGAVTIHLVDTDLNDAGANASLQSDVETKIDSGTVPGTVITANQENIRVVQLTEIEVELVDGASAADTEDRIKTALSEYITAVDRFNASGEKVADGWPWGGRLYPNEVISIIDQVEAVHRVGTIRYQYSDDYGTGWSGDLILNAPLYPGWAQSNDQTKGLLHWAGSEYPGHNGFTLTTL